jgi:hypothetical protein
MCDGQDLNDPSHSICLPFANLPLIVATMRRSPLF